MNAEGDPAREIVQEAEKEPGTLVTMSTHGRSGIRRWLLGSVTDKVIHTTRQPLLVVRPNTEETPARKPEIGHVIVGLDGSMLAEKVLPHATAVAKAADAGVTLVRVTESVWEYRGLLEDYVPTAEEHYGDADVLAGKYLAEMGKVVRAKGVRSIQELTLHGNPASAILELASKTPDSLVAMSTRGRSGLERWLLGSVTDRVIRHSTGPVLVVRPAFDDPDL